MRCGDAREGRFELKINKMCMKNNNGRLLPNRSG